MFSAAPDAKDDGGQVKGIPLPLNPAQVPNPLQPHHAKDLFPPEAVHHRQSESPSLLMAGGLGSTWAEITKPSWFQLSFIAPPLPTVAASVEGV